MMAIMWRVSLEMATLNGMSPMNKYTNQSILHIATVIGHPVRIGLITLVMILLIIALQQVPKC